MIKLQKMRNIFFKFALAKKAVAAVEFALILPVMALIYLGTVEVSMAIAVQRKVAITSGSMGDLTAQYASVTDSIVNTIFSASAAVMEPYSSSTLTSRVSSVSFDGAGVQSVLWSYQKIGANSKQSSSGPSAAIPGNLVVPNTSLIVSEINYTYSSPVKYIFASDFQMSQTTYFRPRSGTSIPFETGSTSSAWPLATSGANSTKINPTYAGFGPEYMLAPTPVARTSASTDSVPSDLQNAWYCTIGDPRGTNCVNSCNSGGTNAVQCLIIE